MYKNKVSCYLLFVKAKLTLAHMRRHNLLNV